MRIWKVILAAVVIFGAGIVTGALMIQFQRGPESVHRSKHGSDGRHGRWGDERNAFLDRLDQELGLTNEQRTRIEQILRESQQRMNDIWETVAPRSRDEFRRVREEIRQELSPEQIAIYEKHFKPRGRKPGNGKSSEKENGKDGEQPGDAEANPNNPAVRNCPGGMMIRPPFCA